MNATLSIGGSRKKASLLHALQPLFTGYQSLMPAPANRPRHHLAFAETNGETRRRAPRATPRVGTSGSQVQMLGRERSAQGASFAPRMTAVSPSRPPGFVALAGSVHDVSPCSHFDLRQQAPRRTHENRAAGAYHVDINHSRLRSRHRCVRFLRQRSGLGGESGRYAANN